MKEIRSITGNVELRSEGDGNPTISGYAAVFNGDYVTDWMVERIDPKAFDNADMTDTIACFNHDESELMSRVTGNADDLVLSVDSKGLKYEFKAKNECALETAQNIQLGFIRGSSFAFTVKADRWEWDVLQPDGSRKDVRYILEVGKLYDVSAVTHPAYKDTTVALRSRDDNKPKPTEQRKDLVTYKLELRKNKHKDENK